MSTPPPIIDSDLEPPSRSPVADAICSLKPGDSILLATYKDPRSARAMVGMVRRRRGLSAKFSVRKTADGPRVWRIE